MITPRISTEFTILTINLVANSDEIAKGETLTETPKGSLSEMLTERL